MNGVTGASGVSLVQMVGKVGSLHHCLLLHSCQLKAVESRRPRILLLLYYLCTGCSTSSTKDLIGYAERHLQQLNFKKQYIYTLHQFYVQGQRKQYDIGCATFFLRVLANNKARFIRFLEKKDKIASDFLNFFFFRKLLKIIS